MKTIRELVALLEGEVRGAEEAADDGSLSAELRGWHDGRAAAYRHALAQARHVLKAETQNN